MRRAATAFAAILLVACGASAARAQSGGEAYGLAADIVTRTRATGEIDQLLDKLRIRMIAMVVSKSGKTESEAAGIVDTIVFPSVRDAMPTVRSAIVATRVQNDDLDDLRGLDHFDRSTLGQHLISQQPQITAAIMPAVSAIVATRVRQALHDHAAELRQKGVTL